MNTPERPLIGFHMPGSYAETPMGKFVDPRLDSWGRAEIIESILNANADVLISRGRDAFSEEGFVHGVRVEDFSRDPAGARIRVEPARVAIDSLDAVRNIAGVIQEDVPQLNHAGVRAIAANKLETNNLLGSVDLAKQYAPWNSTEDLGEAFDKIDGDRVVLKPVKGSLSNGVESGTKQELARLVEEKKLEGAFVIEEHVDLSVIPELKGRDAEQQALLDHARTNKLPTELRAYTFGKEGDAYDMYFVLGVAFKESTKKGRDAWVLVDQTSVPEEIRQGTAKVCEAFQKATGAKETHLGIDWTRLHSGVLVPMEVNAGEPQLVTAHQDARAAKDLAELAAKQLLRAAKHGI